MGEVVGALGMDCRCESCPLFEENRIDKYVSEPRCLYDGMMPSIIGGGMYPRGGECPWKHRTVLVE